MGGFCRERAKIIEMSAQRYCASPMILLSLSARPNASARYRAHRRSGPARVKGPTDRMAARIPKRAVEPEPARVEPERERKPVLKKRWQGSQQRPTRRPKPVETGRRYLRRPRPARKCREWPVRAPEFRWSI